MKTCRIVLICCFLLTTITVPTFAQSYSTDSKKAIKLYKLADEQIRNRQFDEGLYNLEKAMSMDKGFTEARFLYAKTYSFMRFNKDSDNKVKEQYEILYSYDSTNRKYVEAYYKLMEFEIVERDFQSAKKYMNTLESFPGLQADYGKRIVENQRLIESALNAEANGVAIDIKKLPEQVNFGPFQFRPFFTGDEEQIYFTAKVSNNEDVFICKKDSSGKWGDAKEFLEGINTKYNEGFVTVSADGHVMVYASTKPHGVGKSDLYISYYENGKWSEPKNMGPDINCPGYDSEPALSADGKALFYSSSRKGGKGGKDIWYVEVEEGKKWGKPFNLGREINTSGNEVTPFIHPDNKYLYFASDNRDGLGGYDVYSAARKDSLNFENAVNLGYPINTQRDEGSFIVNLDYTKAYIDIYDYQGRFSTCFIYNFEMPDNLSKQHKSTYAKGFVYDEVTKTPLEASVELIDVNTGEVVQSVSSDQAEGSFLIILHEDKPYAFQVKKDGYMFYSKNVDFTHKNLAAAEVDVPLIPVTQKNKSVVLENIFFDSRKYELLDASKVELNTLVTTLNENSELKLLIEGHTDNVGDHDYNVELSYKRAQAVYNYLVQQGIDAKRLKVQGYGESKPRATNETQEGRALNRRIELKMI